MTEWTKQEYEVAMQQRDDLFPVCGEETAKNILNLLCQRNRALWALNDVHDFLKSHGYDTTLIDSAIAACTEGK
jgi:hypothetical protein